VPLSAVRTEMRKHLTTWTNDTTHGTACDAFVQEVGPVIPEDVETPSNIFIHLFTEDLIDTIVFHTNLYFVQNILTASEI
jgi:hypothetical protein